MACTFTLWLHTVSSHCGFPLHHTPHLIFSDGESDGNTGESDGDERRGNAEDDALASKHRRAQFASRQARAGSALRREQGAASHGGA